MKIKIKFNKDQHLNSHFLNNNNNKIIQNTPNNNNMNTLQTQFPL